MNPAQNNQEVSRIVLHATIEFPGLESGVSINTSKYSGLQMVVKGPFLQIDYRGITGLVPLTNIKFLLLK